LRQEGVKGLRKLCLDGQLFEFKGFNLMYIDIGDLPSVRYAESLHRHL